jgi:hypothetical protein
VPQRRRRQHFAAGEPVFKYRFTRTAVPRPHTIFMGDAAISPQTRGEQLDRSDVFVTQ